MKGGRKMAMEPDAVEDPQKMKRGGKRMAKRKGRRKASRY